MERKAPIDREVAEIAESFVKTVASVEGKDINPHGGHFFSVCYRLMYIVDEAVRDALDKALTREVQDRAGAKEQYKLMKKVYGAVKEDPKEFGRALAMKGLGVASFDEVYPAPLANEIYHLARQSNIDGNIRPYWHDFWECWDLEVQKID